MDVSTAQLLQIIGAKSVEIAMLQEQVAALQRALAEAKAEKIKETGIAG